MAKAQVLISKFLLNHDFWFPIVIWISSRTIIWTTMVLTALHLVSPITGIQSDPILGIFHAWDSRHYHAIATAGYEFVDDSKQHNLAFFPLFPFSIWMLMKLGISFELAGILINNLAFLGALYYLYFWMKDNYNTRVAQWVTTVFSLCPLSMFTTVIYTEGLYLFLSTATLYTFEQKKYQWTAVWGALATATRPTGMALIPALLLTAAKERRPFTAYIGSIATATGLLLFSLYSAINFHDPLAFLAAQKGWRPSFGFDWQGWLNIPMQIILGYNWYYGWVIGETGGIKDNEHLVGFSIFTVIALTLWLFRKRLSSINRIYSWYGLAILVLIIGNELLINNLLNLAMVLGSGLILWKLRQQLSLVIVLYGFCGIGLLLASGGTISLSRLAYGIVPLTIGIGVLLSQHPRHGYLTLGLFVIVLIKLAMGFAQQHWVG